jgi:hypothetical protein
MWQTPTSFAVQPPGALKAASKRQVWDGPFGHRRYNVDPLPKNPTHSNVMLHCQFQTDCYGTMIKYCKGIYSEALPSCNVSHKIFQVVIDTKSET